VTKRYLAVFLLLLSAGIFYASRQREHSSPEVALLKKLYAIETAVPPIWPGFTTQKAPLIVRFGREGAVLVGSTPEDTCGFRPIRDIFPFISKVPEKSFFKGGYYLPWLRNFNVENYRSCAGEVHFSNYNLMQGVLCRDVLFHEYFHSYQKRHFKWRYSRSPSPLKLAPDQAAALYIEQILLSKALRSVGQDRINYARAFSALRFYRKRLSDPYDFNKVEDSLEAIEGVAVYVESRARDFDVEGPGILRAAGAGRIAPSQVDLHIAGELLMTEFSPDMLLFWRQYHTGAAQGLLMDWAGADWKESVQNGKSVFSIFSAAFPVSEGESGKLADAVKLEYDYAGLASAASRIMFPRDVPFVGNEYQSRIVIRARTSPPINMSRTGDAKLSSFADGTTGMTYDGLKVSQKGVFEYESENFGAFSDKRRNISGKEYSIMEISLLFPLSRVSMDKTGCSESSDGVICDSLALYGVGTTLHFTAPVRLIEKEKLLSLEVLQ
jgi:hypothetical protein